MTTITDPRSGVTAVVKPCKVCDGPIYFGYTEKGRRCPFDVVEGQPTRVSHFTTCAEVARFRDSRARLSTAGYPDKDMLNDDQAPASAHQSTP